MKGLEIPGEWGVPKDQKILRNQGPRRGWGWRGVWVGVVGAFAPPPPHFYIEKRKNIENTLRKRRKVKHLSKKLLQRFTSD